jgi:hypothetical protein
MMKLKKLQFKKLFQIKNSNNKIRIKSNKNQIWYKNQILKDEIERKKDQNKVYSN